MSGLPRLGDSDRCLVMGIVNRTPDSFYDPGRMSLDRAVQHGMDLVEQGADVLDLGGVKAGPGAPVSEAEETRRLLPLVEALASQTPVPLSVETARATVARRALEAGASIVNDVTGLSDPGMAEVCAEKEAWLVLLHHGGQVRGRPLHPRYGDVVAEVCEFFDELALRVETEGVASERIIVDPGLDFGKTTYHSLELMRRLDEIVERGRPVLVAPSRKDVVGETLGVPLEERLAGTLALVALAVAGGAAIVRVHDVPESVQTVAMVEAVLGRSQPVAPVRGLWE
jgi:dihydropteroate synthase